MSETTETPPKHSSNPKRNRLYKTEKHKPEEPEPIRERTRRPLWSDPQVCLAIYIAMAHAGLLLSLALLYGLAKLLQGYWRPIQWAILCSIPLRHLQSALFSFYSHPLNLGLFETLISIPLALLRRRSSNHKIGFSKLTQWLFSFGLFVLVYEHIGIASLPASAIPCFIAYATGFGIQSDASSVRCSSRRIVPNNSLCTKLSHYLTSRMLNRLKTAVGIGIIALMIVGSVSGFVFFSYKIGIEGKDAVISLKAHLEESNYAERIRLKKWIDENRIPELIESYTAKFYETVSQNIDSLALHYNVTEIVDGFRHYLIRPLQSSVNSGVAEQVQLRPLSEKLYCIQSRVRNREWKVIYRDIDGVFREFMSVIAREDLVEKIKAFVLRSMDVSKRVFASGSMVLVGGTNLLFSLAMSIVSGAAELLNFISQMMVFFWLLYYLITSNSGGVMDHVLGMLPLSKSTRVRCAQVLDHAVSSVLLAAAKVTFFQGCLTYLLFRFYRIHFLYTSTFLALMSAVLPMTPAWLSSVPAAAQLAMEARYIEAILLTVIHLILLDYGTTAIQDEISGQNAYLTGLSILGGIALFPSALEGAIMGPLLMTVMIALKNLYVEFVLASANKTSQ